VRFGRIPKREKQRLLDEMQSYMNSLNESASMEMEVSSPPDAPCSPQNQANDGAGSILQSYRSDEKPLKMAGGRSNLRAPSYRSGAVQESAISHTSAQTVQAEQVNLMTSYRVPTSLPVAPSNHESSTNTNIDNGNYNFSIQNQCPVSGNRSSQAYASNQNSFPAGEFKNQNSCPWKLNGGAKVLVSLLFVTTESDEICYINVTLK